MSDTLSNRALNRALLARQGLIQPWDVGVAEALQRLIGLQSQAPQAPYVALWTRLRKFDPAELSEELVARRAVRIALMRSTIFLVTADDAVRLRPVMQPASDRTVAQSAGKRTAGIDPAAVARAATTLLVEPLTFAELGQRLLDQFPGYAPADLANLARAALPLVQVTPRGVWGAAAPAAHTTLQWWLAGANESDADADLAEARTDPIDRDSDPGPGICRYLAAFGPATVADVQAWSGLAGLRAHLDRLRPRLRTFRNERGQELFDVPDGLLPDPETEVPVRILAEFDNVLLSHADRSRLFDDAHRRRFMTQNGLVRSTVLVDGMVAAVCKVIREPPPGPVVAQIEPLSRLTAGERAAIRTEAKNLLGFLAPDATHRVVFSTR